MNRDQDEFNFGESEKRKEKGMSRANSSLSGIAWTIDAGRWFMLLPLWSTFTLDDVVRANGLPGEGGPNTRNVVGSWINGLAKAKFIAKTGRIVKSERIDRHRGESHEWQKIR
jgi:hypothetical protein